mmetsp:Transcript_22620/g.70813  ORF Transcript_22620/g.70813 Transcript_22620/m.70813 type:complete len:222 (+) Transcript_22620:87-752(+)
MVREEREKKRDRKEKDRHRRRRRDDGEDGEERRRRRRRSHSEEEEAEDRRRRRRTDDEDARRDVGREEEQAVESRRLEEDGERRRRREEAREGPQARETGIYQYIRAERSRANGGLADDTLDPRRAGLAGDYEATKFNRVSTKITTNGAVVKDLFATGVKPDLAADRDFPYQCDQCRRSFLTAVQLSDHLLQAHDIRKHASLIRPKTAARLSEQLVEDDDD